MQNNNEKCNFHLYLGKKDYEILVWKNSLPPKCFKYFVEQILLSHINGYPIILPPTNNEIVEAKSSPIHIVIENKQIIKFLSTITSGDKSKKIKEILLFYIRASRSGQAISSTKKKRKTAPISTSINIPSKNQKKKEVASNISKHNIVPSVQQETNMVQQGKNEPQKEENDGIIKAPIVAAPKPSIPKNPMMQALFKMSGDD